MIRAVVFDLWNTLVQSPGGNPFQRIAAFLPPQQRQQFPPMQRDGMTRVYPDAATFLAAWQEGLGLRPEQVEAMREVFRSSGSEARLFPEAPEALERTGAIARLALLSNTQSFDLGLLETLNLAQRFRVKGLSAELGFLKPDAGAFQAMEKKLGLFPGELALVGDSWTDDVEGALNAGWTALWVNRKGAPRPPHPPEAELVELADLSRVPDVIERLQTGARCSTCLG